MSDITGRLPDLGKFPWRHLQPGKPCSRCHRKHVRCDRQDPCQRCQKANVPCLSRGAADAAAAGDAISGTRSQGHNQTQVEPAIDAAVNPPSRLPLSFPRIQQDNPAMAATNGQEQQFATQISSSENIQEQKVEHADAQPEAATAPQQHVENTHGQDFASSYPALSAAGASPMQIEHQDLEMTDADSSAFPAAQQETENTPLSMARPPIRSAKRRKYQDKWDTSEILKPGSPLGQGNMKALFNDPRAWEALSPEEKQDLIALMPKDVDGNPKYVLDMHSANSNPAGTSNAGPRLDPNFLRSSVNLSHDIGRFQEDIREGRLDPKNLRNAVSSFQARHQCPSSADDNNNNDDEQYEAYWRKKEISKDMMAGFTSKAKIEVLMRAAILQVGDIFEYWNRFSDIVVDKQAKLVQYDPKAKTFVFEFPPGQYKFSDTTQRPDIVTKSLTGIDQLTKLICEEHGGLSPKAMENTNAWKSTSILRDGHNHGTLFDLRQAFAFRLKEDEFRRNDTGDENKLYSRVRRLPLTAFAKAFKFSQGQLTHFDHKKETRCDQRITQPDGIPCAQGTTVIEAFARGPASFPTEFQQQLAGGGGWSSGHAHLGAISLGLHKGLLKTEKSSFFENKETVWIQGGLRKPIQGASEEGTLVPAPEFCPRFGNGGALGAAEVGDGEDPDDVLILGSKPRPGASEEDAHSKSTARQSSTVVAVADPPVAEEEILWEGMDVDVADNIPVDFIVDMIRGSEGFSWETLLGGADNSLTGLDIAYGHWHPIPFPDRFPDSRYVSDDEMWNAIDRYKREKINNLLITPVLSECVRLIFEEGEDPSTFSLPPLAE